MREPRVFLDTSALFAAVLSASGGGRAILRLGELGAISLWVGPSVVQEADGVFRRKASDLLPLLATLLDRANVRVGGAPPAEDRALAGSVVGYKPDADVVAEALAAGVDYLVTHDATHLLRNPRIGELPLQVGSPGDCLAWLRQQWAESVQDE